MMVEENKDEAVVDEAEQIEAGEAADGQGNPSVQCVLTVDAQGRLVATCPDDETREFVAEALRVNPDVTVEVMTPPSEG